MRLPLVPMVLASVVALLCFATASGVFAAGQTPRCKFNYTNNAQENANWDKLDAALVGLSAAQCSTSTTSSTSSTTSST